MIIEQLDEKIFYYKNVLNDPLNFINQVNQMDIIHKPESQISKWNKWTASDNKDTIYGISKSGTFSNIRFGCEMDISSAILINSLKFISDICLSHYCLKTNEDKPVLPDNFSIRRYDTDADMGKHVDAEDPTDTRHPVISGVLYLNDDYEGGEIEFPEQQLKLKPEAGSLIIFPAGRPYYHWPKKLISGNKYIVPFFWYKNL